MAKNTIQTTDNYKMFKFLKGNRPIVPVKIKKLIQAYRQGLDLFPFCPVLINEANYIIEGQHRYHACKELKIPVHYMMVPNFSLIQIALINSNSNRWKMDDFFNCFIETGNKDYIVLKFFKDKYQISLSIACQLLMDGHVNEGGGKSREKFMAGLFKVNDDIKAEKIMKAVRDYHANADQHVLSDRAFIKAINMLMASPLYLHKEVVQRFKDKKLFIEKRSNHKEYIYHIEELYNKGNSKRYILYQTSGNVKIINPKQSNSSLA